MIALREKQEAQLSDVTKRIVSTTKQLTVRTHDEYGKRNDGVKTGQVRNCQTSSDLTHLGDGGLICGDAAELLVFWRGCSGQPQHQRKQTLVPAEGLFGQLTARQRRVQRQVQLDDRHGQERQG